MSEIDHTIPESSIWTLIRKYEGAREDAKLFREAFISVGAPVDVLDGGIKVLDKIIEDLYEILN